MGPIADRYEISLEMTNATSQTISAEKMLAKFKAAYIELSAEHERFKTFLLAGHRSASTVHLFFTDDIFQKNLLPEILTYMFKRYA